MMLCDIIGNNMVGERCGKSRCGENVGINLESCLNEGVDRVYCSI